MRITPFRGKYLALLAVLSLPAGAVAQESPITPYELPRNAEYGRQVTFSRLQDDITYVESHVGPLPLDGLAIDSPAAQPVQGTAPGGPAVRLAARLSLILLAAALAAALWRNRQMLAGLLGGGSAQAGERARQSHNGTAAPVPGTELLDRLRRMADRRAALVLLTEAALGAAARQNGLRLGRSETARDLLGRLPRDWPHLAALRGLVMEEELVQFGGRPVQDARFETCLSNAAPILSGAPA